MTGEGGEKPVSPYLPFLVPPFFAVLLNLILVVYPFVFGIITGDFPFGIIGLDAWVAHGLLGVPLSEAGFAYAVYVPFLLWVYLISFVPGFLIGLLLLWSPFKELVGSRELTVSEMKFAFRVVLDPIIFGYFGILALNPILAYLAQYPWQQVGFLHFSLLAGYIMTGFITGNCVAKSIFPVWLYFTCRDSDLRLVSVYVDKRDSKVKPLYREKIVRWTLVPSGRK
jgi:hypothetical protein